MLNDLKKSIRSNEEDETSDIILEATHTSSIKDAFLDDPDFELEGAENDPEIEALIGTIPEYGGGEESTEESIESLTESISATEPRPKDNASQNIRYQIDRLKAENRKLNSEAEFYQRRGNTFQMVKAKAAIKANDKKISELESKLD